MQTGSYFTIGTKHVVCEDYAVHGENYVILSDGCSNGGNRIDTDWGARLLCKAAEQHLDLLMDDYTVFNPHQREFNKRCIEAAAEQVASIPHLSEDCLAATLLVALIHNDGLYIHIVGDGAFHIKFASGESLTTIINYNNNAPYYLYYDLSEARKEEYFKQFGNIAHITNIWGDGNEESYTQDMKYKPHFQYIFNAKRIDSVAILSDGVESFYKTKIQGSTKQNIPVETTDVLDTLLDFKNFTPGFVERQGQWVFKTKKHGSFGEKDWHNGDDVSLGVIKVG